MHPRWIAALVAVIIATAFSLLFLRKPAAPDANSTAGPDLFPSSPDVRPSLTVTNPPLPTPRATPLSPILSGFLARAREANIALAKAPPANTPHPLSPNTNAITEMQLSRMADGAWLVDQLHVVRGQGTAAEPYSITWDLLLSATETYAPAAGSWELPKRLRWLDGKQLQIKGFLTSPTRAAKSDHLLLTWSALDACCLGPPPNPCQAVEVKLETPITLDRHVLIGVTVEGTFKLEPRLAGGLGLSLFRLANARIVAVGGW